MPDASGRILGITVPDIPWLQTFEPGERVRLVDDGVERMQQYVGREGEVLYTLDAAVVVDLGDVAIKVPPGELRRLK